MLNNLFIREASINWESEYLDSYLFEISSLHNSTKIIFNNNITFFSGENGTGKSTLLEAIAISYGLNPEGGSRDFNFSSHSTHSNLYKALTLTKGYRKAKDSFFLRAESFYNVASKMNDYAGNDKKSYFQYYDGNIHEKSHGESFLALINGRLKPNSIYILDEPEGALSPQSQLTLLAIIYELAKENTQFIIATHSPILLGMPNADIFSFADNCIKKVNYTDTESYKITEMFINNRNNILKKLWYEFDN